MTDSGFLSAHHTRRPRRPARGARTLSAGRIAWRPSRQSDKALAFFSNIPAVSEALAEHAVVPAERSFASSLWRLLQEEVDAAAELEVILCHLKPSLCVDCDGRESE